MDSLHKKAKEIAATLTHLQSGTERVFQVSGSEINGGIFAMAMVELSAVGESKDDFMHNTLVPTEGSVYTLRVVRK